MGQIVQPVFRIYVLCYHANDKCFTMKVAGDTPSPWCHNEPPLAYSYIQKAILICLSLFSFTLHWSQVHWDNGFLAYWDTKQLPNFLLAVPCVLMVLHHSWEFVQVGKSDAQVSSTHCQTTNI